MESGLESISCLWKSFYKSGQNQSVYWSDNVNGDGSILLGTAQTKMIENQLFVRILKSVHTVSATGVFSLMAGKDIHLITTVFSFTEGNDLYLKTAVFRKTDHEYPVIAHPALVLKRDFERNKKLQDDRLCGLTNREVQSSFDLEFLLREHVSVCVFFCWIELSL